MTPEEERAHIRNLADSRCKNKHRDYYDDNQCFGQNAGNHGGPCDNCLEETRNELLLKRSKAHGRLLTPEEAAEARKSRRLDD